MHRGVVVDDGLLGEELGEIEGVPAIKMDDDDDDDDDAGRAF